MWKAQEKKDTTSYERRKRTLEDRYSEDDHDGDQPQSSNSNYWMKKLIKEEEKHPDRWETAHELIAALSNEYYEFTKQMGTPRIQGALP